MCRTLLTYLYTGTYVLHHWQLMLKHADCDGLIKWWLDKVCICLCVCVWVCVCVCVCDYVYVYIQYISVCVWVCDYIYVYMWCICVCFWVIFFIVVPLRLHDRMWLLYIERESVCVCVCGCGCGCSHTCVWLSDGDDTMSWAISLVGWWRCGVVRCEAFLRLCWRQSWNTPISTICTTAQPITLNQTDTPFHCTLFFRTLIG